jgi:chromosome segregation ATPase
LVGKGEGMVSIFINTNSHPNLFKNNGSIEEPNQSFYKSDYLKELLEEQNRVNEALQKSMKSLRISFQKQRYHQDSRWRDVVQDMNLLKENTKHREEFEKQTREWITMLERNSQELHRIAHENSTVNQDILKEIYRIHQSNEEIMQQLMKLDTTNENFSHKIGEMTEKQELMAEQVSTQHEKQDKVLDQLENQEALMEKSNLQLTNLRSILFERTGFIADKIEESYKLTSSVLYKFLTGTDKPLTLMMTNQKKQANKKDD